MKNMKNIQLVLGLVIGFILGASLLYMVGVKFSLFSPTGCTGLCVTGLPAVESIRADSASAYISCYQKKPVDVQAIKAFTINLQQLHAMNLLYQENPRLTGFRMYFGIVGDPVDVMVIYGVTGTKDDPSTIYVTERDESGPCPDLCHEGSDVPAPKD